LSWFIAKIPEDYFVAETKKKSAWAHLGSFYKFSILIIKNILGLVLFVGGLMMLLLPGQGLLTILAGLILMDYPKKFQLERKLIAIPSVFSTMNWIRRKSNKRPLRPPQ